MVNYRRERASATRELPMTVTSCRASQNNAAQRNAAPQDSHPKRNAQAKTRTDADAMQMTRARADQSADRLQTEQATQRTQRRATAGQNPHSRNQRAGAVPTTLDANLPKTAPARSRRDVQTPGGISQDTGHTLWRSLAPAATSRPTSHRRSNADDIRKLDRRAPQLTDLSRHANRRTVNARRRYATQPSISQDGRRSRRMPSTAHRITSGDFT